MRKIIAALVGGVVLMGPLSSLSAADLPGEQFIVGAPSDGVASAGVVIDDSQKIKGNFATLQSFTSENSRRNDVPTSVTNCTSYGSGNCSTQRFFNYQAFMSNCESSASHDCVLSVGATSADGTTHKAIFVEDFPGKTEFSYKGSAEANLPDGGSSFIVDIPTLPHSQGSLYLVSVNIAGFKEFGESRFKSNSFAAGIFAVTMTNGRYQPSHPSTELAYFNRVGIVSNQRTPSDLDYGGFARCVQATATRCALAWPLPSDVTFSLKLKLRTKIQGWLHGRLGDVSASIATSTDGDQLITVSGKPLIVPIVYQWFHLDSLPTSISKFYNGDKEFMKQGTLFSTEADNANASILKDYIRYEERDFPEAMAWYDAIGDRANAVATAWTIRSIEDGNLPASCGKASNQLSGIVTTNSNMFIAEPPKFNRVDQTLDYKVASPHYLPDGTIFKGTYNLVMRSDYARCIYNYSSAPVSASVSVLSLNGTSQIATSTLYEKSGWLYLSANNFTFSSPTLKVKLTQKVKTQLISCTNGSKVIKTSSSVCPKGYRKK